MKAKSWEMFEKSLAAMVAAIEVYNKPNFEYREETFSILAVNGWELLLKAKWLKDHSNKATSLYVYEKAKKKDGTPSKKLIIKQTRCGNPFTHGLDYLANKLVESGELDPIAHKNIEAICEIRDSAVHFYNKSNAFSMRLQEVGSASLKNYVQVVKEWFGEDLTSFNFYLMPLAFLAAPKTVDGIVLSKEEAKLVEFIEALEGSSDPEKAYAVSVNIEIKYSRSKAKDALSYQLTTDPKAPKLQLTEEQFKQRYPYSYEKLNSACRKRYEDFLVNKKYHDIRAVFQGNPKYCMERKLDPDNPKSASQTWYSEAVFTEIDKHYKRCK